MNAIDNEIEGIKTRIESAAQDLSIVTTAKALLGDIDVSDVAYVSSYTPYGDGLPTITLGLKESAQGSKLAHALAQAFRVTFQKSKQPYGNALRLSADHGGLTWQIDNYLGQCKLVQTEVPLTEQEIAEALAKVPRSRIVTTLDCGVSQ